MNEALDQLYKIVFNVNIKIRHYSFDASTYYENELVEQHIEEECSIVYNDFTDKYEYEQYLIPYKISVFKDIDSMFDSNNDSYHNLNKLYKLKSDVQKHAKSHIYEKVNYEILETCNQLFANPELMREHGICPSVLLDSGANSQLADFKKVRDEIILDILNFIEHKIDIVKKKSTISNPVESTTKCKNIESFYFNKTAPEKLINLKDALHEFIDRDTKLVDFKRVFSGKSINKPINWTSNNKNELRLFISRLSKHPNITIEGKLWDVARKCFLFNKNKLEEGFEHNNSWPKRANKILRAISQIN